VRLLLSKECKIDARDEDGNTPIHLAASQGHRGIVEELIQHDRPCVKHRVLTPHEALKAKYDKTVASVTIHQKETNARFNT